MTPDASGPNLKYSAPSFQGSEDSCGQSGCVHWRVFCHRCRPMRRNAQDNGLEQLNATLWMQTSPEYRAGAEQVYRLATERIANPRAGQRRARTGRRPPRALARLPTAVVLDLDETVLDNTVYQARLIRDRAVYDTRTWGEWVVAGQAEAVPGAREFIAAARRLGHTVFYVSNRDCTTPPGTAADPCPAKTATMRNLVALGHRPGRDPERMLLRGERPEWATRPSGALSSRPSTASSPWWATTSVTSWTRVSSPAIARGSTGASA